ncbi:beta-1,3-mannanase [Astrocystis sublimbata]|nr:beta-1,3-mannanase [Astrocystis sublimbata]
MKTSLAAACLALAGRALGAASFPGSNLYYAAGLSTDQQDYLFKNLQDAGVKVLRVWLDGQSESQKGTKLNPWNSLEGDSPGSYDDTVLTRLDDVMHRAATQYDIKLMISMHSYNTLKANNDFYGKYWGTGDFYTNSDAISTFQKRISHVMSHKNPNNGKTWAESSEYIFAFEAQNEADQPNNHPDTTSKWQCTMAQTIKDNLNGSGDILITTGGGGWVDASLPDALFSCDALDVLAIHAYGDGDLTVSKLQPKVDMAKQAGKKLIMQEWGVCYFNTENNVCNSGGISGDRDEKIKEFADAVSKVGIPWMYWQIIPNSDPHDGYDYEIGVDNENWDTLKSVAVNTANYTAQFDFEKWLL